MLRKVLRFLRVSRSVDSCVTSLNEVAEDLKFTRDQRYQHAAMARACAQRAENEAQRAERVAERIEQMIA